MDSMTIPFKNKLEKDQLFKISRFKERIKKTKPHKHEGYYELIYIHSGEGFHWVEVDHYKISAPEVYFLKPGCMHCWQFTSIPSGYVILFKEEYFDALREPNLLDLLQKFTGEWKLSLTEEDQLEFLFLELLREYQRPGYFSSQIINGYLQVLFAKILQLSDHKDEVIVTKSNLSSRFQIMLGTHCPELHLVQDYAQLLGTSPQNLNAACRKDLGKNVSEMIIEQLMLEAKRYILHSEKSIREIAFTLHFSDTSYFTKFFKRNSGMTPLQFRRQFFQ